MNGPEVIQGNEFLWDAFEELNTCRMSFGMGIAPIPWTAMKEYADHHRLTHAQFENFAWIIRMVDDAFRKHMKAKEEAGSGGGKGKAPSGRKRPGSHRSG